MFKIFMIQFGYKFVCWVEAYLFGRRLSLLLLYQALLDGGREHLRADGQVFGLLNHLKAAKGGRK